MTTIRHNDAHDPLLERKGSRISYTRVGPTDDRDHRKGLPDDHLFIDEIGSKSTEPRPALEECLKFLQAEDILFVKSMDRLGRNLRELLDMVKRIANIGTAIIFVDEDLRLDPRAPDFDANFRWLKSMYRFVRALINERRNEGLFEARKKRSPPWPSGKNHRRATPGNTRTIQQRRRGIQPRQGVRHIRKPRVHHRPGGLINAGTESNESRAVCLFAAGCFRLPRIWAYGFFDA